MLLLTILQLLIKLLLINEIKTVTLMGEEISRAFVFLIDILTLGWLQETVNLIFIKM